MSTRFALAAFILAAPAAVLPAAAEIADPGAPAGVETGFDLDFGADPVDPTDAADAAEAPVALAKAETAKAETPVMVKRPAPGTAEKPVSGAEEGAAPVAEEAAPAGARKVVIYNADGPVIVRWWVEPAGPAAPRYGKVKTPRWRGDVPTVAQRRAEIARHGWHAWDADCTGLFTTPDGRIHRYADHPQACREAMRRCMKRGHHPRHVHADRLGDRLDDSARFPTRSRLR